MVTPLDSTKKSQPFKSGLSNSCIAFVKSTSGNKPGSCSIVAMVMMFSAVLPLSGDFNCKALAKYL